MSAQRIKRLVPTLMKSSQAGGVALFEVGGGSGRSATRRAEVERRLVGWKTCKVAEISVDLLLAANRLLLLLSWGAHRVQMLGLHCSHGLL